VEEHPLDRGIAREGPLYTSCNVHIKFNKIVGYSPDFVTPISLLWCKPVKGGVSWNLANCLKRGGALKRGS